jgi:uncharacterized protein YjiS (DUF1127 family)
MNIFAMLRRSAERRRTHDSLMQLDDHLLRDIGLERSDLHLMMRGTRTRHARSNRSHE